jgi:putative membrane protein
MAVGCAQRAWMKYNANKVAKEGNALRNPDNKRADVLFIPQPHPGAIGLALDCIAMRERSISPQTLHLIVCYAALYTIRMRRMGWVVQKGGRPQASIGFRSNINLATRRSYMTKNADIGKGQMVILWTMLALYATGRVMQMYPERFSILPIVLLQVAPPAIFAWVHGSILYRWRGMAAFTVFCLGAGAACESLSLRTGFPFGHYFFTGFMGPKVLQLPILLVLAYLGIGYCSWVLSLLILGYRSKPLTRASTIALPLLASFIMVLWDLSMDAVWSTLDRAWIWRDGGRFFGVPVSNFLGWYFTAFLFYQAFALYCRAHPVPQLPSSRSYWRAAIVCYGICASGNLLVFKAGLFPHAVTDASGRQWLTMDILVACVVVSVFTMIPVTLLSWHRLKAQEA